MAKKSKIMHNIHRKTLVERYAAKRKDLIKKINSKDRINLIYADLIQY